ncbi:ubiquinol-cytochrome c reductase iron-sulfur subunit [Desulfosporosinus sp. BICA1-9]|uniref:QcrA and Rieske domain-containing protein n=1 Tax=Desulfosporosinus sp. BICA1-9 TaxID=1531958 RepID=UPI0005F16EBE|nr:Rieske 2Fe-2S domain-containing protein [Desulfosporosinus sp. BICA1-9]KJS49459.1 MAG: (2Fe-2S)-binding protein [Peptococcaceae bacterium BRH_c23]KJS89244.1 MAG: (2Fe-2S)-binding protein [Desulfosporosinus sp. BICA1-9]HBW35400.1 (2Fe-2S)-binding protein [Desulfosporosinus sp.]
MKSSNQDKNSASIGRRKFLSIGIGTVGAALGASYVSLLGSFLNPPSASGATELQSVGNLDKFPVNTPTLVSYKGSGVEEGVYVVNLGSEGVIALDFHCTHLECAINWVAASKQFICPCHGGVFDMKGTILAGPPPKSLRRRVLKIEGTNVLIGGMLV